MEKKKGLHYGWLIVFSCFMIMSLYLCIVMNCPGLFLISVTEEFGISRSQYTLNTTVISVAMMIVSLNAGRIFSADRIKKVMMISSIIAPISSFSKSSKSALSEVSAIFTASAKLRKAYLVSEAKKFKKQIESRK